MNAESNTIPISTALPGGPDHSLKSRIMYAAAWLAGSTVASQFLRLFSNLILTRLLLPEAFGLVASVNLLYFALNMFSDFGVWQSVVRKASDLDDRFLGTAWTIQLLRGVLLAFIVLILSTGLWIAGNVGLLPAETVYADSRLPWMMAVFASCAMVQGAESMNLAMAERDLNGRLLARLELLTQIAAMIVTICAATIFRSPWALLFGTFFGGLLRTLLSHLSFPGKRLKLLWDKQYAQEILGFGKWIFLSTIIGFLGGHGEKLILSGYLSAAGFGIFSIATNLLSAIVGVYSTINGRVIFPALSESLRTNNPRAVGRVYAQVQKIADFVLGTLCGLLWMTGELIVSMLYDNRYQGAGWMLSSLGFSLLAMRYQVIEQLMFARSEPHWVSANNTLRAISLGLIVPAGFAVSGEKGAILGVVASQFASWPLSLYFKHRCGLLSWKSEAWWLPALLTGIIAGWGVNIIFSTVCPEGIR